MWAGDRRTSGKRGIVKWLILVIRRVSRSQQERDLLGAQCAIEETKTSGGTTRRLRGRRADRSPKNKDGEGVQPR